MGLVMEHSFFIFIFFILIADEESGCFFFVNILRKYIRKIQYVHIYTSRFGNLLIFSIKKKNVYTRRPVRISSLLFIVGVFRNFLSIQNAFVIFGNDLFEPCFRENDYKEVLY